MQVRTLRVPMLLVLGLSVILVPQSAAGGQMFIAIGDSILEAPKSPETTDPAVESTPIFQEDGVTFNGLVYAGDGLLYACAETDFGSRIFRFDPVNLGPVETVDTTIETPRCGTVDVDGSLVVASGGGGIWKFPNLAGMCLDEGTGEVEFCFPYGSPGVFPTAEEITGSGDFGPAADIAYFYDSDFLSVVAASGGGGPGQGKGGGGGSKGQLLRSIWPAYQAGFVTEGCPPDPLTKNTKILLDDLGAPTSLALSNGDIFVTDGKDLVRVDIPAPTGPFPACGAEPVATIEACESFGNLNAVSLAGEVGGALLVGTGSRNKDAVVYRVDSLAAGGCDKQALLIFPKQDWDTTVSGLAVIPGSLTEPADGDAENPITFDGSHNYTLEASCLPGATIEAGPKTLATVLAHIDSIPPEGDVNTPGFNDIIGSPPALPGYDGFPWMWQLSDPGCDPIAGEDFERHIIASYQRGTNLRIGASNNSCDPWDYPGLCNSAYIQLEFNVPFDPDLVPVDPIGGRRRGTRTFLSSAAIADAEPAEFCGYQSPLAPDTGSTLPILVLEDLPTTLPVKFKLEALVEDGTICGSGQPIADATVMISIARIEAENPAICPDFEVIMPEPNGAGSAGPPPLFDDPGQPSGNYHFNLQVSPTDYCDGLYLITATFLTDNAVEQQTLFRVNALP